MEVPRPDRGSSLVEVLVALLLMAIALLGAAPMFVSSMTETAAGADRSQAAAAATARVELLRALPLHDLAAGGSLTTDQAGYVDSSDPSMNVRWEIINGGGPAGVRTIRVKASAIRQVGRPVSVELTTVRSR